MDVLFDRVIKAIEAFMGTSTYSRSVDITTTYSDDAGFYLYVGVTGTIVGVDYSGAVVSRIFIAGYHKIKMKSLSSGTATNLAAMYK